MTRAAWWCARNFPLMFSKKAVIMKYWDGRWTPEGLWQLYFALLSSLLITAYKWVHDTLDCFFVRLIFNLSTKLTDSLNQIMIPESSWYNKHCWWRTKHFQNKVCVFQECKNNGQNIHCQFDTYFIMSNRQWRFRQFLWPFNLGNMISI